MTFELKEEQLALAKSVSSRRNCIGLLPTGFGKTLCFVINTMISDQPLITLIVSPLLSLMDSQIEALTKWNFKCAKISMDTSVEDKLGKAIKSYLF
jgi:ATP-dependent DNA helicase RecQ